MWIPLDISLQKEPVESQLTSYNSISLDITRGHLNTAYFGESKFLRPFQPVPLGSQASVLLGVFFSMSLNVHDIKR